MIVDAAPKRILVIGDLHTDWDVFRFILTKRGLIDDSGDWCGEDTWVVCMGDIFDGLRPEIAPPGEYSAKAMERRLVDDILRLDSMAQAVGGRVLSIMGNHDVCAHMSMNSRYAKQSDISSYAEDGVDRRTELTPGGDLITKLSKVWPMILVINRFVFVHGSLEPRLLARTEGRGLEKITQLNGDLVEFLAGRSEAGWTERGYNPLFSRYFSVEGPRRKSALKETFSLLGNSVNTMFLGHTVCPRVTGLFGNRVICTDVGLSRAFGESPVEVVEIRDDAMYRIRIKRSE